MITIYGASNCTYCRMAVGLCESLGLEYTYLDAKENAETFKSLFPNAKTVPQIVFRDQHIGGYEDLCKYIEETGFNGTGDTL
jgi:glutaredoxin